MPNRRVAASVVVVGAAFVACSEAAVAPPVVTPPPAPIVIASASASVSIEPVASTTPIADPAGPSAGTPLTAAIRDALPPETKERLTMLGDLCPAAIKHDEKGEIAVGCTTCAPFDPAQMTLPFAAPVVDPTDFWVLENVIPGSFSAPGKKEAALVFTGCESHAGNYGGTELVDISKGGYHHVGYAAAVHPYAGKTIRAKDGRDRLIGAFADGHQGHNVDLLFSFDFQKTIEDGFDVFFGVEDNSFSSCILGVMPGTTTATADSLDGFEVLDKPPRVVVHAIEHHGSLTSPSFKKACAELRVEIEKEHGKDVDLRSALAPAVRITRTIPFDGKAFKKRVVHP